MNHLLLIVGLTTTGIASDVDFFSKFNQNEYKIKKERFALKDYNQTLLNYLRVSTFKFNRTDFATNVSVSPKFDVADKEIYVTTQAYLFLSNEYRIFPLRFQISYCDFLENRIMGLSNHECGNVHTCPLRKNFPYHLCNWRTLASKLPPGIPDGQYKLNYRGMYFKSFLFDIDHYGTVYRELKIVDW
ncbi:uncharacterized protein LOC116170240 [Photinus pyralis]|uniref:uncharacterized protein LOC116170238 n=1 Tax=Photinus pyralis TaxID=7054 RepID=UPI001266F836|nr:uncharacterized protein LOC116170238 [Photinus pyralis]XP_031342342.1 uncharacterized protein LOC116170240 [Photinus pyralis]